MLKQVLLALVADPHRAMPPIQRLRRFLAFLHAVGRQLEITVLEATEPIAARCFTLSSISVNFLELSMRFSRRFLRMKEENQHSPQMTLLTAGSIY